jgi:MYXO-CTERM domain-containing protein
MVRAAALAATLALALPARAFCPSYTLSSSQNTNNCGVEASPGANPSVEAWLPIFARVAGGSASWGIDGPLVAPIQQGCAAPEARHEVPAIFPCELLRAIAMQESGWRQFCVPDEPDDQAHNPARTIISFDCGYGIAQVTSGMHKDELPSFDRDRVAGEPTYNLATGTLILADKWRAAACVGDSQPRVVEDWYSATWAYNGLSFINNPNNPNYASDRPICDPNIGCGARPYQEKVLGWMEHPPSSRHWNAIAPAYPALADLPATAGAIPALPEPRCASPTDCTLTRPTHLSECLPKNGSGGNGGANGGCSCMLGGDRGPTNIFFAAALALLAALAYKRRA